MEINVICLLNYMVDGIILFKKDNQYTLFIDDFSEVIVYYNKDEKLGTRFIGSLNEHFKVK